MFDNLLALIKCILDFVLFFWFSELFLTRRWEKRNLFTFTVLLILAVILNAVNHLRIPVLNTLSTFSFALLINFLFYQGSVKTRIICTSAEVLLVVMCEFLPIFIYSMIYKTSVTLLGGEAVKNAGLNLASTCIFCVIILGIRHVMIRSSQKEDKEIVVPDNLSILAVPLVSILTVYHIFSFDAAVPLANLILLLEILCMNVAVIAGDNNSRKQSQLQKELDRMNRLEQLNRVVIEQQDHYIQEMKGFAHDYTRQMAGIKKMIRMGETYISNDIQNYADEMLCHIEESCRFAFIPSPALRAIMTQAQIRCDSLRIEFDTDIQYGDFSFISFPDLYTLFQNPLENAITACDAIEKGQIRKRICVRIMREKDLIWAEIKNPKENDVIVRNHSIQTTKKDASMYGLGIKNMKRVIAHYDGYLNIEFDSDEFIVTMAFPVR